VSKKTVELFQRFTRLKDEHQEIISNDMETAFEERIKVFEKIEAKEKTKRS